MRLWVLAAAGVLVLGGFLPGFAQQQTGLRALENLVNSDETQKPAAAAAEAAEAASTDAGPKRPAGTMTRPKDGVKHPDLDKAWMDYDTAVRKVAEEIRAAINKQFDAAAAKGDLDAAEKWQTVLARFEQAGDLPSDAQIKVTVATAVKDYKKAREELEKVYESVVKSMTMEKKIADAMAVRDELRVMPTGSAASSEKPSRPGGDSETKQRSPGPAKQNAPSQPIATIVGKWNWNRGRVLTFLPNGTTDQGHTWSYDRDTGRYRFSWNAVGELSKDGQTITEVKGTERFMYTRAADQ